MSHLKSPTDTCLKWSKSSNEDQDVETFFDDISKAIDKDKTHHYIIFGDLNAKVCKKKQDERSVGKFGIGIRNPRGQFPINYAESRNIYIMNKNEIDFTISSHRHIIADVSVINQLPQEVITDYYGRILILI